MVIAVHNCCCSSLLITSLSPVLCLSLSLSLSLFSNHRLMADIRRDQRQTNPPQTSLRHRHQGCGNSRSGTCSYISWSILGIKIHLNSFLAENHSFCSQFQQLSCEDSAVTSEQCHCIASYAHMLPTCIIRQHIHTCTCKVYPAYK